jgi:predicted transcriptional regulator
MKQHLQMLQEAATAYSSQNDNVNELSADQQNRLQESLQQANDGRTLSNEEVKQKINEWLSK